MSVQSQQSLTWELLLFVLSAEDKLSEILTADYHSLDLFPAMIIYSLNDVAA